MKQLKINNFKKTMKKIIKETIENFTDDDLKNILWIYGRTGCGKTKLVNSLIKKLKKENKRICPLSANRFLHIAVKLIINHEPLTSLISRCQNYDLLVLDNIDIELNNKSYTQKEIKWIVFEIIKNKKTKVVLISEKRPRKLPNLRLHTEDCYYIRLKLPEYNLKINLLKNWARKKDILIPEKIIINIAKASKNLFQLKGLFNKENGVRSLF